MKRILIIEENSSVRSNIIELLTSEGYETFEAENGKIGITLAKKVHPNLIISDILLPEINGYEVLLELQRDDSTASIPFIFLSAFADISNKNRSSREGKNYSLTKPYKTKDLLNVVNLKLNKSQ